MLLRRVGIERATKETFQPSPLVLSSTVMGLFCSYSDKPQRAMYILQNQGLGCQGSMTQFTPFSACCFAARDVHAPFVSGDPYAPAIVACVRLSHPRKCRLAAVSNAQHQHFHLACGVIGAVEGAVMAKESGVELVCIPFVPAALCV